jgi:hypothetical protein
VITTLSVEGFDPLEGAPETTAVLQGMVDDANRRVVQNILNSYAGFYDIFSELIQNALDAVQQKKKNAAQGYQPHIWILVDMQNRRIRVVDNGTGMDEREFKFCLRPSVSFKKGELLRGHKGVGATYLAYGFSLIKLQTRKDGAQISAVLRGGRKWAEDHSGTVPRPRFETTPFDIPELTANETGTSVEILLGDSVGERPRDLAWIGARNAEQWLNVLRMKTPLGGVYLHTPPFKPKVSVIVQDPGTLTTRVDTENSEYYYPHDIPGIKVKSVNDISSALTHIEGDAATKFTKLKNEYKKLDCIYEVWDKDSLLSEDSPFATALADSAFKLLIEKHRVVVYGAFLRSAKMWSEFNDDILKLRKNARVMHGGLQLASDEMVQGDLSVIPLTSTIGYQANSHVIVHFAEGNPDMGRKVFQPELKALADLLAIRAVTIFKRYLQHLRPDTGSVSMPPSKQLHEWRKRQEEFRDQHGLSLSFDGRPLALLSEPQQEQDVVALFHELIGLGQLKGIGIFATSQNETYDSLFALDYPESAGYKFDKTTNPLGVSGELNFPFASEPRVLEYKYDFDSLVADIENDVKFSQHINFVVCWTASGMYKGRFYLNSLLVDEEGSARTIFGSTHQAYSEGSNELRFEVLILEDLLNYLQDPAAEQARQKLVYRDD